MGSDDESDGDTIHIGSRHGVAGPSRQGLAKMPKPPGRVSDDSEDDDDPVYVPSRTPTPTPVAGPSRGNRPPAHGRDQHDDRSSSPAARRTRWTAAQQFAMISCVYTAGYAGANWDDIAAKVNRANPQGIAKTRSRTRQAMSETHWTNFLKNNNQGHFPPDLLTVNMPDMSGPISSTGKNWSGPQKEVIWAETFGFGERAVK